MKEILLIFILITSVSCSQKETVKGDLFVRLLDFGSYHRLNDEQIQKYDKHLDSLQKSPGAEDHDKEFYSFIGRLKKNGLIKNPYMFLRLPSDSVLRIYLSDSEFEKVKKYTYWELQRMDKKVEVEVEIKNIDEEIWFSDHIIEVKEVEGQTPWDE